MFRSPVHLLRPLSLSPSLSSPAPTRPPHTPRLLSGSAPRPCPSRGPGARRWALEVSPFCTVRARLGRCSVSVRPLDAHAFPGADRAFVGVGGEEGPGLRGFTVRYDPGSQELLLSAPEEDGGLSVDLAAPIKSNLFISTRGRGSVQVEKMECDICTVHTEEGDCALRSVKGHQIEVRSDGGHVTGEGTIHGNVDIRTRGDGSVDVKKLQGTGMNVSTERGPLKVKAIYAESTRVSSSSGRIQLGNVHGTATVENISGDTVIDGSNDLLKVSSEGGDVDVYVGDGGSADVRTRGGHVRLRVPSSLKAGVDLRGASVDVDSGVALRRTASTPADNPTVVTGYMNEESAEVRWVKVQADRGSVTLRTQSWFEALKLGGHE